MSISSQPQFGSIGRASGAQALDPANDDGRCPLSTLAQCSMHLPVCNNDILAREQMLFERAVARELAGDIDD